MDTKASKRLAIGARVRFSDGVFVVEEVGIALWERPSRLDGFRLD